MRHAPSTRFALLVMAGLMPGCGGASPPPPAPSPSSSPVMTVQVEAVEDAPVAEEPSDPDPAEPPLATVTVEPSGLQVEDLVVGTGLEVVDGSQVEVHYVGTLLDGSVFDASRTRSTPFSFKVGSRMVIPGFDQGVTGMRVGGVRRITIPPELAYGASGRPPVIPPASVLVFELEVLSVR